MSKMAIFDILPAAFEYAVYSNLAATVPPKLLAFFLVLTRSVPF